MAVTTCIVCGRPIPVGLSRCAQHQLRNGSGTGWRALRAKVLARDFHTCRIQADGCTGVATHVDHRTPIRYGGTDDPSNLQASCASCNLGKGTRGASK